MDGLLSINAAAELINVHPETLRRWDREGTLKAVKVNDRGDRRYRKSDILEFIGANPELIRYNKHISHGGYLILWASQGFETIRGNFHLIAKIIIKKDDKYIFTAYFIPIIEKLKRSDRRDDFDEIAIDHIKNFINDNKLKDEDMHTFEFKSGIFIEVNNPEWWEGNYSKTLVPGLRIQAGPTHPTSDKKRGWRVILNFKCKNGDYWVSNTFGPNNIFHEYFAWVDSKELVVRGFPNTAKSAEIVAIDYGGCRFEETKDVSGIRDISRIIENNAAFFDGKWVKDSTLPGEE